METQTKTLQPSIIKYTSPVLYGRYEFGRIEVAKVCGPVEAERLKRLGFKRIEQIKRSDQVYS